MSELREIYHDPVSAALWGRFHTRTFIATEMPKDAVAFRGPLFREDVTTLGPRSYRRPFDEGEAGPAIIRGGRTVKVTIAPGVDQESSQIRKLMHLAEQSDLEVCAESPRHGEHVHRMQVSAARSMREDGRGGGGMELSLGTSRQSTFVGGEGAYFLAERVATTADENTRRRLCAALLAHEELKRDLFVTTDDGLIAHRLNVSGIAATAGIVTPNEADLLISTTLRGRDKYFLTPSEMVDEGIFYGQLAHRHISNVIKAFRHLVHEANESGLSTPDYLQTLESVVARYEALLVLADEVGRLHLTEGRQRGGNNYAARHLSILRESITIYTAALDACALFVAQRTGQQLQDLKSVTWWKLRRGAGVFSQISGPLVKMQKAASKTAEDWPDLVSNLRHALHHRDQIECTTGAVASNGLTYATFTLVRLDLGNSASIPVDLPQLQGEQLAQPLDVQHGLTRNLCSILQLLFGATDWPNYDWHSQHLNADSSIRRLIDKAGAYAEAQWWW